MNKRDYFEAVGLKEAGTAHPPAALCRCQKVGWGPQPRGVALAVRPNGSTDPRKSSFFCAALTAACPRERGDTPRPLAAPGPPSPRADGAHPAARASLERHGSLFAFSVLREQVRE